MGYTHYWTPKVTSKEDWNQFVKDVTLMKRNLPRYSESAGGYFGKDASRNSKRVLRIRGGMGTGRAAINQKEIWLNGDEKRGLDHETFCITPDIKDWNFCKTARKPYDLLVCVILIHAHSELGYEVSSDGDLEDWQPAIDFYFDQIFGEGIQNFDYDQIKSILPDFLWEEYTPESYKEYL